MLLLDKGERDEEEIVRLLRGKILPNNQVPPPLQMPPLHGKQEDMVGKRTHVFYRHRSRPSSLLSLLSPLRCMRS